MTELPLGRLDPLLHQPIRTQIMAFLHARESASFSELKEVSGVTDGNLDAHMKKLIQSDYVQSKKDQLNKRKITVYSLTKQGQLAFLDYVSSLQQIIEDVKTN